MSRASSSQNKLRPDHIGAPQEEYGALGGIRTHDLSLRRAALYPAELQAHEITSGRQFVLLNERIFTVTN